MKELTWEDMTREQRQKFRAIAYETESLNEHTRTINGRLRAAEEAVRFEARPDFENWEERIRPVNDMEAVGRTLNGYEPTPSMVRISSSHREAKQNLEDAELLVAELKIQLKNAETEWNEAAQVSGRLLAHFNLNKDFQPLNYIAGVQG